MVSYNNDNITIITIIIIHIVLRSQVVKCVLLYRSTLLNMTLTVQNLLVKHLCNRITRLRSLGAVVSVASVTARHVLHPVLDKQH